MTKREVPDVCGSRTVLLCVQGGTLDCTATCVTCANWEHELTIDGEYSVIQDPLLLNAPPKRLR